MRLKYMFHGKNREVHPFYVKSDWNPPVQPSVALESYLEEVKSQLAEIKITKPKNAFSRKEHEALTELKQNTDINLKKSGQGEHYSSHEQNCQNKRGSNTNRRQT